MKAVSLVSTQFFFQPKQRCNGLGVDNLARSRHANGLLQRKKPYRNAFVLFRLSDAFLESAREINGHALIQKARTDIKEERLLPAQSRVTSLLDEFALRGGKRALARINASGGQFPHAHAGCISILPLQKNLRSAPGIVEWQNHDRP